MGWFFRYVIQCVARDVPRTLRKTIHLNPPAREASAEKRPRKLATIRPARHFLQVNFFRVF